MIDKFLEHIKDKHNSKSNLTLLNYSLQKIQKGVGKDLDSLTYEDIQNYIRSLNLSDSSIETIQKKLIQYYNWQFNETEDPKWHKIVKQLKNSKIPKPKTKINPVDLVSPEEAKKLINVATMERDRVIVATLFEGGLRVGELLALTNVMVTMDESKQEVIFNIPDIEGCKTGQRSVICVEIYGYVQDWMKCNTSDRFIPLSPKQVRNIVANLYNKAGIHKKCNPHMLRHSAITHWVNIGMQQNAISMRAWGIPNSNMLATYIHLSEQMQATAYKNAKGMNGDATKVINPLASKCVECGKHIQTGSICKQCADAKKLKEENEALKGKVEKLEDMMGELLGSVATLEVGKNVKKK